MYVWRIIKYNPSFRDNNGVYINNEWTSFHDIGKVYGGIEFTIHDYMPIEDSYINTILLFMGNLNITSLTVKNLEKYKMQGIKELNNIYSKAMSDLFLKVHDDSTLSIEEIICLCRLILREHLWCKLESGTTMFIHFGYDYYMYIGSSIKCSDIIRKVKEIGLFIEESHSPYI